MRNQTRRRSWRASSAVVPRISHGTRASNTLSLVCTRRIEPRRPPRAADEQQAAGPGLLALELAALGHRAAEVAGAEGDGVGDVGRHRRHAEGGQRREGDEGAAAGHGVHRAGRHRRAAGDQPLDRPCHRSARHRQPSEPAPTSRRTRRSSPARRRAGRGSGRCSRRGRTRPPWPGTRRACPRR